MISTACKVRTTGEDSYCASCHMVLCLEIESLIFGFTQHYTEYAQMALKKLGGISCTFVVLCSAAVQPVKTVY